MAWTVRVSDVAERQLRKLDRPARERIVGYLDDRIEGCKSPRHFGEALKGGRAGLWRYRVGDYRIVCQLRDDVVIVLLLAVGHRREIYRR